MQAADKRLEKTTPRSCGKWLSAVDVYHGGDESMKENSHKKRQEDAKKKQSGEIPPDMDQNGKMINPHNPDFITKVPWYLGESGPTLKHHNVQKVDHYLSLSESDNLIKQKVLIQQQAKKQKPLTYRKGACKNCGAMTHKEKDCVERPRSLQKSAWKTGIDIAPDEAILDLEKHGKISYDAKRDQWQVCSQHDISLLSIAVGL